MTEALTLTINIDGAARGNPGPAAWAYVIQHDGEVILEENGKLGQTTNNVAEYTALLKALTKAAELKATTVHIKSDSELLVKQMNGQYKVKNANLLPLYQQATQLRRGFERVDFTHVYREQNKEADRLCNEALDGKPLQTVPSAGPPSGGSPSPLAGEGRGGGAKRTSQRSPTSSLFPDPAQQTAWQEAQESIATIINENDDASPEFLAERIAAELKQRGFRAPVAR